MSAAEKDLNQRYYDAAHTGDIATVRECLDAGADIDWIDPSPGFGAITAAADHGQAGVVRLLIERGAKLEPSAAMEACNHGRHEIVKILLDAGCDPNWKIESTGETSLHVAACRGYREGTTACVRHLLAAGADPNVHTIDRAPTETYSRSYTVGETPLHLAAAFGDLEMIRLLVEAGADPDARDADGHTPWTYFSRGQRGTELFVPITDFDSMANMLAPDRERC